MSTDPRLNDWHAWQRIAKTPSTATRHVWFDEDWQYGDIVANDNGDKAMVLRENWAIVLSLPVNHPDYGRVVLLASGWRRFIDASIFWPGSKTYRTPGA